MGKYAVIAGLILLLNAVAADADIVTLSLAAEGRYDPNSPYWQTEFDLGVTFTEISHVYMDWSGEIMAGLAVDPWVPGPQPFRIGEGIYASLGGEPYARRATIHGGPATYPEPESFDCRSDFELLGLTTWSDLLDGRGTIMISYSWIGSGSGYITEHGFVDLASATLEVEGNIVPEPATIVLLVAGIIGVRARKRNR